MSTNSEQLINDWSDEKHLASVAQFRKHFVWESWTLYGVAVTITLLRYFARWQRFGFRGTRIDDVLMFVAVASFTVMVAGINGHLSRGTGTAWIPPEVLAHYTPKQYAAAVLAGKWVYIILHMQIITLWSAKACMITMYLRITEGLKARRWLIATASYVGLSFAAMELSLFLTCMPIQRRWTPSSDVQCLFYDNYQITDAALSVSSTFVTLAAGLPVLIRAHLPVRQKGIVWLLFGLGIFDVAAELTAKVLIINMRDSGFAFHSWYTRACFVALLVCNLPYTWSLLISCFPSIRAWSSKRSSHGAPPLWREKTTRFSRLRHRASEPGAESPRSIIKSPAPSTARTPGSSGSSHAPPFQRSIELSSRTAKFDETFGKRLAVDGCDEEGSIDMYIYQKGFLDIEDGIEVNALRTRVSSIEDWRRQPLIPISTSPSLANKPNQS